MVRQPLIRFGFKFWFDLFQFQSAEFWPVLGSGRRKEIVWLCIFGNVMIFISTDFFGVFLQLVKWLVGGTC